MNIELPIAVRTMLVSDMHLGSKHSQTDRLFHFLNRYSPQRLYLVGDIVDAWKINAGWHWNANCDQIIHRLLELSRSGTKVYCVAGNHDSFLRSNAIKRFAMDHLIELNVADHFIFETAGGLRLLVTHGDLFDWMETKLQWLSKATTGLYDAMLSANWWQHRLTGSRNGNPYAVCRTLKDTGKRLIEFTSQFEKKLLAAAKRHYCHGVVCGHIHTPKLKWIDDHLFANTGDWIENCTGLIELHDGTLRLESSYDEPQLLCPNPRPILKRHRLNDKSLEAVNICPESPLIANLHQSLSKY